MFRLTFGAALSGDRPKKSWLQDRHLLTGWLIALVIFLIAIAVARWAYRGFDGAFPFLLGASLVSNVVWLGYSAWSRSKERP